VTNQNYIHEEIRSRLYSGNACYHSFQNVLSSRLLADNIGNIYCSENAEIPKVFFMPLTDSVISLQVFKK
jgi:hypothetical protein